MAKKSVYLAEEVIKEILLRLPVKSVLRCKCVCKLWLSIISHPHFAISHFQLAASPTHRIMWVKIYGFKKANAHEALSIDFNASLNDDSAYHSLSLEFLPGAYPPDIRGSCRGFLLLDCYYCLYLWNPSTGVNKHIPLSPMIIADNDATFVMFLYGFGYDRSTDDYIVVVGGSYNKKYMVSSSIDLEIFSIRGSEWEQIELDSDLPYTYTASSEGIVRIGSFLNGSIHWLVYNYETKRDVIIAFDLKEMTLLEIALPDDFYSDYSPRIYLLLFGGLISVLNVKRSKIKIWVMQEYAVHSSWTKTFDFSFHPDPEFSPLCFTNCGDIVGPANGGLVKLNDKGQLLKYHSHSYRYFMRSQMAVYTESLLSLPDGT